MNIIDLSFSVDSETPTCGTWWHEKVEYNRLGTIDKVGRNTHKIVVGSHTATHIDAPFHFIENGATIDEVSLETLCGDISIVDLSYLKDGDSVKISDLKDKRISKRVLFIFNWHRKWKTDSYYKNYPYFQVDTAEFLIQKGVKLIAMDTPSPDSGAAIYEQVKDDSIIHKVFFKSNVTLIEYLSNTDKIDYTKNYIIFALPLKLKGLDGSPARVILVDKE